MPKMYYFSVASFDILLLLSVIEFGKPVVKSLPVLCSQTKPWKLGGRDVVADSKGFVLLVVLMPMQCEHCHKQLMKFQEVMETLPEIRIVVVAPQEEHPRLIDRYRAEFPRVVIGTESSDERVWNTLSGVAHDHFIYDRCGRLASVIRHPKSDTSKFEHTFWALKLAISYAQCGWCQYDPPNLPIPQKPIGATFASSAHNGRTNRPRIKAVVQPESTGTYTMTSNRRPDLLTSTMTPVYDGHARTSNDYYSPLFSPTSSSATTSNKQKTVVTAYDESQRQQQQGSLHEQRSTEQQMQEKHFFENIQGKVMNRPHSTSSRSEQREQQQHEREQVRRRQEEEHSKALEQLRAQHQQHRIKQQEQERIREEQEEQKGILEQRRLGGMRRGHEEERQQIFQQKFDRTIDEQRNLQEQRRGSELYSDVGEAGYERQLDLRNENNWRQLKSPSHQQQSVQDSAMTTRKTIAGSATKASSLYDVEDEESDYAYSQVVSETTAAPTQRTQIIGTERPEQLPFLFEHQVPCAAFTDEICIEQKKRIGADKMSKCCNKGIYLTHLCVPGRCTNATTELCCMQKFLQAKYGCCRNDSAAINSPGDAFSRCCFHKFVQDDDTCCPAERAKFHWSTAHEICLPNVRIDLSGLRFSVHVAKNVGASAGSQGLSDVITIDLGVDKSWDHSCEQGANVLQFPYLPKDDGRGGYGGGEERR
ncbi:unnamed protein product [Litomosoides sigmodontis]|uniref:Selenoprotein P N-terminal domain-containing protein n=1 Tax=Litomosoides sigmodontis TaxID=42156 RepID=A0A3P6TMB7_LITSI|nr:unnamed protein product [Litomosoides sigmodontis]